MKHTPVFTFMFFFMSVYGSIGLCGEEMVYHVPLRDFRIYCSNLVIVRGLFEKVDALISLDPFGHEQLSHYSGLIQKNLEEKERTGALTAYALIQTVELFKNWLGMYASTYAGKEKRLFLADLVSLTERTL